MSTRRSDFWPKEQSTEDERFAMFRVEEYINDPWLYWGSIENAFLWAWEGYLPEEGGHHVLEVGTGGVEMISYSGVVDAGINCLNPITYGDTIGGQNWTMEMDLMHHAHYVTMSVDSYHTKPPKKFMSNLPILVGLLLIALMMFFSVSDPAVQGVKKWRKKIDE